MPQKLTQEQWIEKATAVHGTKYDYSKVVYTKASAPVAIICPIHGEFSQTANSHLRGCGCKLCGRIEARQKADYETRAKTRRQTNLRKYGVENVMSVEAIKQRQQISLETHYGVTNPQSSSVIRERTVQTNLDRYGATSFAGSDVGKERIQATVKARYGTDNWMQSDDAKRRIPDMVQMSRDTQLAKYGAPHFTQSAVYQNMQSELKQKEQDTKRQNGSFNKSKIEDAIYDHLVEWFGESDIIRQYASDAYPYACDFYVISRDMYIEVNAFWSHGGHWFDAEQDADCASAWLAMENAFYQNAFDVWTGSDVEKRNTARMNHLNYIVFWLDTGWDADVWFAMDCPDGEDWRCEYSWLPVRNDLIFICDKTVMTGNLSVSMIARSFTWELFYQRELQMWHDNPFVRPGVRLRHMLYFNRYHYLGKLPEALTDNEILRGLSIAGYVHAYSSFDNRPLRVFLDAYKPDAVFDPCAGWGERLLTIGKLYGISYYGCDVRADLVEKLCLMQLEYKISNAKLLVSDAATVDTSEFDYDCVFTCPPYGNTEIYSDVGAENLLQDDFLDWWRCVVSNATKHDVKLFAYQIDMKHRDSMNDIVASCGYVFVDEIVCDGYGTSHFSRAKHQKRKNYEMIQVFRKKD